MKINNLLSVPICWNVEEAVSSVCVQIFKCSCQAVKQYLKKQFI